MKFDPQVIDPAEPIARFACEGSYYRTNGTAKPKAFQPDRDSEVSVFRIAELGEEELWELADSSFTNRGKLAEASIEFAAYSVVDAGLRLERAEPPERHAAIRAWPEDQNRLLAQQLLASMSTVRLRP
jgi:hypothetical protein